MDLLDRYLFIQFCKNLFLVIGALMGIFFLVDFFEKIDNFFEAGKSISLATRYFLFKTPYMLDMLQPVCILLAGVLTLGLLNHNNELDALKAGGVSTLRIIRPLLLSSLFCTLLVLILAQWVLPATLTETNRIWNEEIKKQIPKGTIRQGRIYYQGAEGIYTFLRPDPQATRYTNFSYTKMTPSYDLALFLTADEAIWENGAWTLKNGQLKTPAATEKNRYTITLFETSNYPLPETPDQFFTPKYKSSEQSISTLFRAAEGKDATAGAVTFHSRLSFIFLGLPLIFMGLPVLLLVHQRWGHDLTLAVPISCGIAFAAWGWWSTSQSLAKADYLHPIVASWALHVIICPFGYWLLKKQDTWS